MNSHKSQVTSHKSGREEKILIAGFGGQGIVFLGNVIAQAANLENKHVAYIRSYGAEMRGGTAHCMVKISDKEISSPIFKNATVAFIMNRPSLNKFKNKIEKNGVLIVNTALTAKTPSSRRPGIKKMNLSAKAIELGSIKVANIIGLGLALRKRLFVRLSSVERALIGVFKDKEDLLKLNLKALRLGYKNG